MKIYSIGSKLILSAISITIVFNAIFFTKTDTWPVDLFYYLPAFSLVVAIDFMFYELNCPNFKGINHAVFCTFPISRWKVLLLEVKFYINRWEILFFLGSVLFYLGYFYSLNNSKILLLLLILFLYSIQIIYLIIFLFISKNFLGIDNLKTNIKNLTSLFITLTILLYTLAGISEFLSKVFFVNPFSCGFLSYLLETELSIFGFIFIILLAVFIGILIKKKFKEWPVY
jgi:hypothetical protein